MREANHDMPLHPYTVDMSNVPMEVVNRCVELFKRVRIEVLNKKCSGWCNSRKPEGAMGWKLGAACLVLAVTNVNKRGNLRANFKVNGSRNIVVLENLIAVCCEDMRKVLSKIRREA